MSDDKIPKIRVLVRKRPLSRKQELRNETDIITIQNNQTIVVKEQKQKVDLTPYIDQYRFNFDGAFNQNATNQQIYLTCVRPLVDCAFDGAKVTCFAYGQTGSGKTHTMLGDGNKVRGLSLLAAFDLFQKINHFSGLSVWVSFYEIYCGKLYDLLNERNILFAREDAKNNVNIVGLSQRKITGVENLMQIIQFGTGVRVTSQNGTNVDSSRSHAILQISLKVSNKVKGKISFIDLAGSQRAADHSDQVQKQTRIDGAQINKSLLALKECIRALDQNKFHTPFRGSKLTMVLKDSFTGYCRTVMIGNISPNSWSCQNTLNTLKYADRVKQLKKPTKQHHLMQLDNLDQLSKELMLPRQLVNHVKYDTFVDDQTQRERQNNKSLEYSMRKHQNMQKNKKISVVSQPNHSNNSSSNHYETYAQNSNQKQRNNLSQNYFSHSNQNGYVHSYSENQNQNMNRSPVRNSPHRTNASRHSTNVAMNSGHTNQNHNPYHHHSPQQQKQFTSYTLPMQQNQPTEDFQSLARQHENYISLILQQEEELMKSHQRHINSTIESVKQEMLLMSEADKVGSSIQDYIGNLQGVLDSQMNSIKQIKGKITRLKGYLRESKKIQEKYIIESNQKYPPVEDSLLGQDDQLFS